MPTTAYRYCLAATEELTSWETLRGVLSKYPTKTIGIIIVPFHINYTRRAIEEARNSQFKIILTDTLNPYDDLEDDDENHEINLEVDGVILDDNYISLWECIRQIHYYNYDSINISSNYNSFKISR
ncbi:unnamed protein product [Rhizophagus irregularis]|nr:unnamed protein product [Rhizophagus irregularis]